MTCRLRVRRCNENLVVSTPDNPGAFTATAQPGATSAIVMISSRPDRRRRSAGRAPPAATAGRAPAVPRAEPAEARRRHGAGGTRRRARAAPSGRAASAARPAPAAAAARRAPAAAGTVGTGGDGGTGGTGGTAGTADGRTRRRRVASRARADGWHGRQPQAAAGTGGRHGRHRRRQRRRDVAGAAPDRRRRRQRPDVPLRRGRRERNAVVVYEQGAQIFASKYTAAGGSWSTPRPRRLARQRLLQALGRRRQERQLPGGLGHRVGLPPGALAEHVEQRHASGRRRPRSPHPRVRARAGDERERRGDRRLGRTDYHGDTGSGASVRTAPGALVGADGHAARRRPRTPPSAVAMAGNGNAFVGWVQADGASPPNYLDSIWVRQYTAGSGAAGTPPACSRPTSTRRLRREHRAPTTTGDAIVTYIQVSNSNPATIQLWARRYSATTNSFATNPSKVFDASTIDTSCRRRSRSTTPATPPWRSPSRRRPAIRSRSAGPRRPIRTGRRSRPRWRPNDVAKANDTDQHNR